MSIASNDKPSMVEKLWGKQPSHGGLLAYASADASVTGSIPDTLSQNPMLGGSPPYDKQTAVYDIAAKKVYLPDGTTLEAHSGLGAKMDDVRYAHVRMQGVTPPHIYDLKPREALFHGVPALRLTPIGGQDKIFNRDGLLAHTYMLGNRGDSNGCISFKDYYAFLNAYRNRGIRRIAVLAKVSDVVCRPCVRRDDVDNISESGFQTARTQCLRKHFRALAARCATGLAPSNSAIAILDCSRIIRERDSDSSDHDRVIHDVHSGSKPSVAMAQNIAYRHPRDPGDPDIYTVAVSHLLFQPFNTPAGSMVPTLLVGDHFFVSKYAYGYTSLIFAAAVLCRIFGSARARRRRRIPLTAKRYGRLHQARGGIARRPHSDQGGDAPHQRHAGGARTPGGFHGRGRVRTATRSSAGAKPCRTASAMRRWTASRTAFTTTPMSTRCRQTISSCSVTTVTIRPTAGCFRR